MRSAHPTTPHSNVYNYRMENERPAEDDQDLVIVFIPALSPLLLEAENLKGSALTNDEVVRIRDNAVCVAVPRDVARAITESRGYADLDPENCWHQWQLLRREVAE